MNSHRNLEEMQLALEQLDQRIERIRERRRQLEEQMRHPEKSSGKSNSLAEELARAALRQGWSRDAVKDAFGV